MNPPFDSKPISQNPLFFDNVPHIELRAKREVTLPFDMSTAYRQTNFRDRPEYAPSPRVAAETPNGVPGRPMNPHTSCNGGDSGASAYWRATIPRHLFSLLAFGLDTAMRRNQTACRMTGDGLRSDDELRIWESMLQYPVLLPPSL